MLNRRQLLLAGCCSLLAGCGFRLRGYVQLPAHLQPVFLHSHSGTEVLTAQLQRQLLQSGVQLTEQISQAGLVLELQQLTQREIQIASGSTEEYELELILQASAEDAQGNLLLDQELLTARRYYSRDTDASLLVRDQLRQELYQSMQQDLINQMILRVQALGSGTQN